MLHINQMLRSGQGKAMAFLIALALGAGLYFWPARRFPAPPPAQQPQPNAASAAPVTPNADKAEIEAAKQRAQAARPFVLQASEIDKERLQSLITAYSTALQPVPEPPLLDLTSLTGIHHLTQKKQIVQSFLKANDALRSFFEHREESYRETLLKLGLPSEFIESVMQAYRKTAAQPTALALKMRKDDDKMGTALLGILNLLQTNWGRWTFNPAKQKVEFSDHATREKFLDLKEALDQASLEQMACQIKLAALETSE
jgi:hypothetical protein